VIGLIVGNLPQLGGVWRPPLRARRLAVRRSVGVVKAKGASERLAEGPTKTGQSRVVDLDAGTVAAPTGKPAAWSPSTSSGTPCSC
jgi:hypothetical protein